MNLNNMSDGLDIANLSRDVMMSMSKQKEDQLIELMVTADILRAKGYDADVRIDAHPVYSEVTEKDGKHMLRFTEYSKYCLYINGKRLPYVPCTVSYELHRAYERLGASVDDLINVIKEEIC